MIVFLYFCNISLIFPPFSSFLYLQQSHLSHPPSMKPFFDNMSFLIIFFLFFMIVFNISVSFYGYLLLLTFFIFAAKPSPSPAFDEALLWQHVANIRDFHFFVHGKSIIKYFWNILENGKQSISEFHLPVCQR